MAASRSRQTASRVGTWQFRASFRQSGKPGDCSVYANMHPRSRLAQPLRAMRTFVITAHTSVTFSTNDLRKSIPMVHAPRQATNVEWSLRSKGDAMFVDRIKSPRCPQCGAMMSLRVIEPERPGFDSRTFECPKCYDTETFVASISHEINVSIGPA
jgi:hypothetical protein